MKTLDDALARYHAAVSTIAVEEARKRLLEARVEDLDTATRITQSVAQSVQDEAHARLASIVTRCMQVFDDPYTFHIRFDRKRGKTEARLVFERDGVEFDPLRSSGGGVIDVAAFALRLSALTLQARSRMVLFLDEPFRFVPVHLRDGVRELVEWVSKELDCQILMVTHEEALQVGKVVEL